MNKKYLALGLFGFFAIALISAAIIEHYGLFSQEINVINPVSVSGETTAIIDCLAGTLCLGELITISNIANSNIEVDVSNDAPAEVGVVYLSTLAMESKDAEWIITGSPMNLYYTILGNEFVYKTDTVIGYEDYVIIYYPDADGNPGSWNIDEAIYIGDVTTELSISILEESLPIGLDYNDAAKLWIIPEVDWNAKSWNPTAWLFEHELIKYDKADAGYIEVEAESSLGIYPVYMPSLAFEGIVNITTSITP